MEDAGPSAAAAAATGGDWRSQINSMAREVMVKQIMKTLRLHLPMSDPKGLSRLQAIAHGFERKFYDEATSKTSYSRKIAMLLIYVENINQDPHRQGTETAVGRVGLEPLLRRSDDKGKAPISESPGDELTTLPQEFWNSVLYPAGYEDPTYESMDNRATNLKKRRIDGSSSSAPPLGQSLSSSLAIPGESSTLPSWESQLQFQEWASDN